MDVSAALKVIGASQSVLKVKRSNLLVLFKVRYKLDPLGFYQHVCQNVGSSLNPVSPPLLSLGPMLPRLG